MRRKHWLAAGVFAFLALGALLLVRPGALTGEAGGAGCEAANSLADAELARSEGRYLVMEIMVALALGLEQADRYIGIAEPLLTDSGAIAASNQENCFQSQVVTASQATAPKLKVDFMNCPSESGRFEAGIAMGPPEDVDPATLPPQVAATFADLPPGTVVYDLAMYDTKPYGVLLEGSIKLTDSPDSERITTDLSFDFLDYSGSLAVDGTVVRNAALSSITMAGTFRSSGGLDWAVDGSDLGVEETCRGLKSGRLTGTYGGDGGAQVQVVASFDGSCDGCAAITLDGVEEPKVCIPEALALQ
jgi:hypothetical protein